MNVWYVHVTNLYMKINFTQKENVYEQNHWYIYTGDVAGSVPWGTAHCTVASFTLVAQHWATYSTLVG